MTVRTTCGGTLVVLTLMGCAGDQFSLGSSAPAPTPVDSSMVGRWILATPNAPSCGLEFKGAASARAGLVTPDGGCPANFYLSRQWAMVGDALTIADNESQPLAQLKSAGSHFEGRSAAGTAVTLSR